MIKLQFNEDGIWIYAKSETGYIGMLSLNNIVNDMKPAIARKAFIDAIKEHKTIDLEDSNE